MQDGHGPQHSATLVNKPLGTILNIENSRNKLKGERPYSDIKVRIQKRRLVQETKPRKETGERQGVISHGAVSDYTPYISCGPYWR